MLESSCFAQEGAHPPPAPTPYSYSYIVNDGFPPPPQFRILDRTLVCVCVCVHVWEGRRRELILLNRLLADSPAFLTVTSTHLLSLGPGNVKKTRINIYSCLH